MEKPRITEINVRMDCNGCVQKIKKALHGITGIYDIYIDFPQQKITVIGSADPGKIVKAIKKTRKSAVICLHTEQPDEPPQPPEPTPENGTPHGGAPPAEPQTETEPPTEQQQLEHPPPEANTSSESADPRTSQSNQHSRPKDSEEIHVVYHHPPLDYGYRAYQPPPDYGYRAYQPPPDYGYHFAHHPPPDYGYRYGYAYGPDFRQGYGGQWNTFQGDVGFRQEPPRPPRPIYVSHSYNTYRPSPYVTEYVYPRSPPRYSYYSRPDYYSQDYYYSGNNGNSNITSMFSEENPNACRIV